MRFKELCLLYESLSLVKGNYGRAMSANDYEQGLKNFIGRSSTAGASKIIFYLGKPGIDKSYLQLDYYPESGYNQGEMIPARYFYYVLPTSTIRKFSTIRNQINNTSNEAYFAFRSNVFVYKGNRIPKAFSINNLRREMENLVNVNEYFVKQYGVEYSFLGDIYTPAPESLLSQIGTSWELNKSNLKALPGELKSYFQKTFL